MPPWHVVLLWLLRRTFRSLRTLHVLPNSSAGTQRPQAEAPSRSETSIFNIFMAGPGTHDERTSKLGHVGVRFRDDDSDDDDDGHAAHANGFCHRAGGTLLHSMWSSLPVHSPSPPAPAPSNPCSGEAVSQRLCVQIWRLLVRSCCRVFASSHWGFRHEGSRI